MMADVSAKELLRASKLGIGKLAGKHQKLAKAFGGVASAALEEGHLTVKVKELIAVGIAVQAGCDFCIAHHVEACLKAGATEEEIAETCGVAVLMGGGPALMYSGKAMEMVEELKK
jgi:AhpD family alkylhydroperoxidase